MSRHEIKTPIRMTSKGPGSRCCGMPLEHWPMVSVRRHGPECAGVGTHNYAASLLHTRAMARFDDGERMSGPGTPGGVDAARAVLCEAARMEMEAAGLVHSTDRTGPWRGILYRSAAWMAVSGGDHELAREAAQRGLACRPGFPGWLVDELNDALRAADAMAKG